MKLDTPFAPPSTDSSSPGTFCKGRSPIDGSELGHSDGLGYGCGFAQSNVSCFEDGVGVGHGTGLGNGIGSIHGTGPRTRSTGLGCGQAGGSGEERGAGDDL